MKRRLLVLGSTVAVALVALLMWFLSQPAPKPLQSGDSMPTPSAPSGPTARAVPPVQRSYEVPPGGAVEGLSDPRWKWWNKMEQLDPSFEWKMPISFYGRVVNQDGQPVPGAAVRFIWNDMSARGTSESKTESDAAGRFSLLNQTGKGLSVYVTKEGYHSSGGKGGQSFEYAAFFDGNFHTPNPESPVTFRLIKKLDAEPLIARHLSARVTYEQPSYYDLELGTLTQQPPLGAGLKFILVRSEAQQAQPFDWKWKVEAVNGALQETHEEFAQLAPEEGYVPAWQTAQAANAKPFRQNGQAHFFVRTTAYRYARVNVELVHPNLRSVGPRITVDSFLNPSGSRNLEYDPSKQAPPP